MHKNLISGLYERIKNTKIEESKSKSNNEFNKVAKGLIDFINRNPDITNDDIKLLSLTNRSKSKYISALFYVFSDLVGEIKQNGGKSILAYLEAKNDDEILNSMYASKLNDCIENAYAKNKKQVYITINNKYHYKYLKFWLKKSRDSIIVASSHSDGHSSGCYSHKSNINIKDVSQIIGLVNFSEKYNVKDKEIIEKIIKTNVIYDFSVLETIVDAKKDSVWESLEQGEYGIIRLYKFYERLHYEKENEKVEY